MSLEKVIKFKLGGKGYKLFGLDGHTFNKRLIFSFRERGLILTVSLRQCLL